jgi:hypothetical protein
MAMAKKKTSDHGSSIKDDKLYERLREEGNSKEKAARISNAAAAQGRGKVGRRGGKATDYDERTKKDLMKRAREIGIEGRSKMNKAELIDALRHH